MEKNKTTLVTIVFLLLILIPCTIFGTIKHFEEQNKNHEFYYKGELYFYKDDALIGKYSCKTKDCNYASYLEIDTEKTKTTKLINNKYAFIKDGKNINLFDVETGNTIVIYDEIKSFSISNKQNAFITVKNGLSGVVSFNPNLMGVLANNYDDVLFNYNKEAKMIDTEKVIVKDKETYKIIKNKEEIFTSDKKIIEFNDNIIVLLNEDGTYSLVNYENNSYFSQYKINKYLLLDKYIALWTLENLDFYQYNSEPDFDVKYVKSYSPSADIKVEDKQISVYENEQIIDIHSKSN